jgi:RES domain-containing protein
MLVYRLCRQRYAELSGFGAKKTGGRWNRKGLAALYAAENASLAVVEVLVHLDKVELPEDYVMLAILVPDLAIVSINDALSSRLESLYQNGVRELGVGSIGFSVPSVVAPDDRVVVLYPETEIASRALAFTTITPFAFDRRLFLPSRRSG